MNYYDNNANNIEYFSLHKEKKRGFDFNCASMKEIEEKLIECSAKREELVLLYNETKHEGAFVKLSKMSSFMSILKSEFRKRNMIPSDVYEDKIAELEKEIVVLKQTNVKDDSKEIEKLKANNNSLKGEIAAFRDKYNLSNAKNTELGATISTLMAKLKENKEAEKTKRHELNIRNDKDANKYLLDKIKELATGDQMFEIIAELKIIREGV